MEGILKIENNEKIPGSHKDYYRLRKLYFASSYSKNRKSGRSFECEFREFFQDHLDKEHREEVEDLKKNDLSSSKSSSSSSSGSESDNEQTFQELYDKGRKKIKEKYLRYYEAPHTHENYANFLEVFRKYYGNLTGEEKKMKWRKYWNDKLDDAFDQEIKEMKESLRKRYTAKGEKKDMTRKRKYSKAIHANELVKIKTEPTASQCLPEIIVIEQENTIPRSNMEKFLENYDLRVNKIIEAIDETFDGYLNDKNLYPFIKDEKKHFFVQQKIVSLNCDQYFEFDNQFDKYWPQRIQILRDKQRKLEVERVRANWTDLVVHPNDVTHDDGFLQPRLSGSENSHEIYTKSPFDSADAETQTNFETSNKQTKTDKVQSKIKQNCTRPEDSQTSAHVPSTSTAKRTKIDEPKSSNQSLMKYVQCLSTREQFDLLKNIQQNAPERYAHIKSYLINVSDNHSKNESIVIDSDEESDVQEV